MEKRNSNDDWNNYMNVKFDGGSVANALFPISSASTKSSMKTNNGVCYVLWHIKMSNHAYNWRPKRTSNGIVKERLCIMWLKRFLSTAYPTTNNIQHQFIQPSFNSCIQTDFGFHRNAFDTPSVVFNRRLLLYISLLYSVIIFISFFRFFFGFHF